MDLQVLLLVAARVAIVYAFLFVVVRSLGKRKLGAHSAFDLVVAIVLANLASDAIFGTVSLLHGLLAVGLVAVFHAFGYRASARSPRLHRWRVGEPRVVARDGEVLPQALRAEHLPEAELWSLLRQQGIDDIAQVKLATLEPSGHLSVTRQEWTQVRRAGERNAAPERGAA